MRWSSWATGGIVYLDEFRSALQLLIGVRERRLGAGELRLALFDRGLKTAPSRS